MRYFLLALFCLYQATACAESSAFDRGAQVFQSYCSGCHALKYAKSPIKVSLSEEDALQWFGKAPPDLSLIVTIRGKEWLHDYLISFYKDEQQSYGENNTLLPRLNMPNPFSMLSLAQKEVLIRDLMVFLSETSSPNVVSHQWIGCWILS